MRKIEFHPDGKIICKCGNVIHAEATVGELHVELCSACHPFSTGKQTENKADKRNGPKLR